MNGSLVPLTSFTTGDQFAYVETNMLATTLLSTPVALVVTMSSTGSVTNVFAVSVARDGAVASAAEAEDDWAIAQTLGVLLHSSAAAGSFAPVDEQSPVAWVLNARTGASWRYEQYGYNSFAKIGQHYYGMRSDGLYRLDGDDDAGQPVRAMVSFGKQDFGSSVAKSVPHCYIGVSSAGRMFLRVQANGQEYTYATLASGEELTTQRFDIGKGLEARYFEFELYNADGDDFELSSVEFAPVPTTRRI